MRLQIALTLVLIQPIAAAASPQNPIIEHWEYSGDGCPQKSEGRSEILGGGEAIGLNLPRLNLDATAGRFKRLQCSAIIGLKYPERFRLRVAGFTARVSSVRPAADGALTVSTHLQGNAKTARSERPLANGDVVGELEGEWSPCGTSATFVIKFALHGSQHAALEEKRSIKLAWQACDP